MSRRLLVILALAFIAAVSIQVVAAELVDGWGPSPPWWAQQWWFFVGAGLGLSFMAVGLFAWSRQPRNPIGTLLVAFAVVGLVVQFRTVKSPLTYTLGALLAYVPTAILVHLLFSFPSGRISSRLERFLVSATYTAPAAAFFVLLFDDPRNWGLSSGLNLVLISSNPTLHQSIDVVVGGASTVLLLAILVAFVLHWRRASTAARRTIAPVGWALALLFVIAIPALLIKSTAGLPPALYFGSASAIAVALMLLPIGFLVGLLRSQLARSAVADLVIELGDAPQPGRLRDALAHALGDPSVSLAYWLEDRRAYVDQAGRPVQLPAEGSGHGVALLQQDGEAIAAIIHDPALADEPGLLQAVSGATLLAVQNERLQAALRARLAEIGASRARIVEAADAERRRIERDLHDGTQQRLVSVSLALRLAGSQLAPGSNGEIGSTLTQASNELAAALAELRELARGIHPAILTEEGLGPALESLAERATVPVSLKAVPSTRLPAPIEAAAYFVVSEALANISKYAAATCATVSATLMRERLLVDVTDDGVGGADAARGSGLRGLADRLAALDGFIRIESPPGRGTTVHAEIPCAP